MDTKIPVNFEQEINKKKVTKKHLDLLKNWASDNKLDANKCKMKYLELVSKVTKGLRYGKEEA